MSQNLITRIEQLAGIEVANVIRAEFGNQVFRAPQIPNTAVLSACLSAIDSFAHSPEWKAGATLGVQLAHEYSDYHTRKAVRDGLRSPFATHTAQNDAWWSGYDAGQMLHLDVRLALRLGVAA